MQDSFKQGFIRKLTAKALKTVVAAGSMTVLAASVNAQEVSSGKSYSGAISSVAPGFYGHVGVDLAEGATCRGYRQVVLMTNNPHYTDLLSLLITAVVSKTTVKLYDIRNNPEFNGYCVISEASIGSFSAW